MIPLHVHTNYSLLNSTLSVEDLVSVCLNNSINRAALTDTNAMNGLIQFTKKSKNSGLEAILGAYIDEPDAEENYVILLAKNNKGYSDICKIITQRKLIEDFSLQKILKNVWEDIFIISPSIILLKEINKSNSVFSEIIPTSANKKKALELFNFSKDNGIPIVASHPIYFSKKEDIELHDLITAIRLNTVVDNVKQNRKIDSEFYFKSINEMEKPFLKIPEALKNNLMIANQCSVNLRLGEYKYPVYPDLNNGSSGSLLTKISYEGLSRRYEKISDVIIKRLEYELQVINELNFSDYFLIVWDIVREAKNRGMMTIGRGSAANSLVAYCLELTQVDPIKHNLFFERFLNKARRSPPDIDLDFSWKERDEIVKYVYEKYGYDKVAMISTMITFRARSAFREVAKAFGISDKEISLYSKKIPWTDASNLPNITKLFPESRNAGFDKEPWKTIINFASKIANFPRHLSIHPGGIVITPKKISDYCALEYAKNKGLGLIITQPDMYSLEELGLIKIDLLSQRSLGVLRDTVDVIKKNHKGA